MDAVADFFQFIYSDIDDIPVGFLVCCFKALGSTVVISIASIFAVYILLTTAFLSCCLTIIPIILISIYWDGFWDDLKYSYTWFWLVGLTVAGIISGIIFLPSWIGLAIAIVGFALGAVAAVCGIALAAATACICLAGACICLAAAVAVAILALPIYLVYISMPYCSVFWSSCCRKSCECIGVCCVSCFECLGECCEGSSKCIGGCLSGFYKCLIECWEISGKSCKACGVGCVSILCCNKCRNSIESRPKSKPKPKPITKRGIKIVIESEIEQKPISNESQSNNNGLAGYNNSEAKKEPETNNNRIILPPANHDCEEKEKPEPTNNRIILPSVNHIIYNSTFDILPPINENTIIFESTLDLDSKKTIKPTSIII